MTDGRRSFLLAVTLASADAVALGGRRVFSIATGALKLLGRLLGAAVALRRARLRWTRDRVVAEVQRGGTVSLRRLMKDLGTATADKLARDLYDERLIVTAYDPIGRTVLVEPKWDRLHAPFPTATWAEDPAGRPDPNQHPERSHLGTVQV